MSPTIGHLDLDSPTLDRLRVREVSASVGVPPAVDGRRYLLVTTARTNRSSAGQVIMLSTDPDRDTDDGPWLSHGGWHYRGVPANTPVTEGQPIIGRTRHGRTVRGTATRASTDTVAIRTGDGEEHVVETWVQAEGAEGAGTPPVGDTVYPTEALDPVFAQHYHNLPPLRDGRRYILVTEADDKTLVGKVVEVPLPDPRAYVTQMASTAHGPATGVPVQDGSWSNGRPVMALLGDKACYGSRLTYSLVQDPHDEDGNPIEGPVVAHRWVPANPVPPQFRPHRDDTPEALAEKKRALRWHHRRRVTVQRLVAAAHERGLSSHLTRIGDLLPECNVTDLSVLTVAVYVPVEATPAGDTADLTSLGVVTANLWARVETKVGVETDKPDDMEDLRDRAVRALSGTLPSGARVGEILGRHGSHVYRVRLGDDD